MLVLGAGVALAGSADENAGLSATDALYQANCAACHGTTLKGGFGPALKGEAFHTKWFSKGVSALSVYMAQSMPPANPGSLEPEAYDRLAALFLAWNGAQPSPGAPQAVVQKSEFQRSLADIERASGLDEKDGQDAAYREAMKARAARIGSLTPVTEDMLRNPSPADWLHAHRTDDSAGFSPLDQINRSNVDKLTVAWSLALPAGTNEITPLVHDGVMFLNTNGTIRAIDVATGDTLWSFVRPAKPPAKIGIPVSQARNMAIFEQSLIVPSVDRHMIALDMRTGKLLWDRQIEAAHPSMHLSAGPIIVRGKILQGLTGCGWTSCAVVALDARSGEELWRFNTIAQRGEPGGDSWNGAPSEKRLGGSVWSSGSYDPETGLAYFGTGQTYLIDPLLRANGERSARNAALYTDTTLALDPDTGRLAWHYQHMARDVWDLDWAFERTVATLPVNGKPRRVVMTMGKIGILDVLDAKTGRYLFSQDLGLQTFVTAIDPKTGWKTTSLDAEPDPTKPVFMCPYPAGFRNWPATSYDARLGLLYIPLSDNCMDYIWNKGEENDFAYTLKTRPGSDGNYGGVAAINVATRKVEWWNKFRTPVASAILSTGGGLVFEGGRDRQFRASDSASGKILWSTRLDNMPSATPISFAYEGTQYVAVTSGGGGPNSALLGPLTPELDRPAHAATLWVFKLSAPAAADTPTAQR
jgi:alcohol dehydrogenase (cytochrome c)